MHCGIRLYLYIHTLINPRRRATPACTSNALAVPQPRDIIPVNSFKAHSFEEGTLHFPRSYLGTYLHACSTATVCRACLSASFAAISPQGSTSLLLLSVNRSFFISSSREFFYRTLSMIILHMNKPGKLYYCFLSSRL